MSLQAGKMNERVTFLRPIITSNDLGEQTTIWQDAGATWATVTSNGGRRNDSTGEVQLTEGLRAWMRINPQADERWRVRWRGSVYAVENLAKNYAEGQMTFNLTRLENVGD